MGNSITLTGTQIPTAVATDPALCRVSGYLKNAHGQPLKGQAFILRYTYEPMTLSTDTLLLQERMVVKADREGYVEFDLLRTARVTLELPNLLSSVFKSLTVPDAASVDLIGFMFPYLVDVQFDDTSPLHIGILERRVISLTGTLSNGVEVALLNGAGVTLEVGDEDILMPKEGSAYMGLSPGTTTITVTEVDASVLDTNQDRYLVDIVMLDLPDPTLPAPLTVIVP